MIKLTEQFKFERGRKLVEAVSQDIRDRQPRMHKLATARAMFYNERDDYIDEPWEGASNLHLPVITEKIEGMVPKLVNAFWGTEPIVHVRRVAEDFMPEETNHAELYLNWGLESDIENMYDTTENWFRNCLVDGQATLKTTWKQRWRNTVDVFNVKRMWEPGQIGSDGAPVEMARPKSIIDILVEIFGRPDNITRALLNYDETEGADEGDVVGGVYEVEFLEARRQLKCRVEIEDSEFVDEVVVRVYRKSLVKDSPCVELMEFEDLIVPYRSRSIEEAPRVTHQYWLTIAEVEKLVEEGEWDLSEEDLDRIRKRRTVRMEEHEENDYLKRQKDQVTGEGVRDVRDVRIDLPDDYLVYDPNKILIFEIHIRDDVNGDGEQEDVIYHVPYDLQKIAAAVYLDEVSPSGKRPFVTIKYLPISDRWYAHGMADLLFDIQLEVNNILNTVNNAQELINNPFFFYVPASTAVDPQILTGVKPGQGIPIQDPNGVVFPQFAQQPLANLQAMDSLLLFGDRLTVSPMTMGNTQVRNAPRTARGTLAMLSEGNVRTDVLVTRFQKTGWAELMHNLMGLYQRWTPDEKWYYVTGQEHPRRVRPADIRGRFEYSFTGNTVNTNREVLRGLAQVRYNTIMTHPDMAMDPFARREALRDFLRHWSEGVDIDRLVPAMPGAGAYTHPPMTQQNENQALAMGFPVDVLPTDDHGAHLQVMEQFQRTPAFESMSPEAASLFAVHKRGHMQMMQQQMAMQQQPQGPGMGNNVPTGMSQAEGGTDMNALEGGVQ
jgi:hypothetical protein